MKVWVGNVICGTTVVEKFVSERKVWVIVGLNDIVVSGRIVVAVWGRVYPWSIIGAV